MKSFNFRLGDSVYYHPIKGKPHTGEVFELIDIFAIPSSKVPVAKLKGKAGCVAMGHLTKCDNDLFPTLKGDL